MTERRPLKILHVLRAPVGGLFRHVLDLARGQAARGHQVGVVAARPSGERADAQARRARPPDSRSASPGSRCSARSGSAMSAAVRHVSAAIAQARRTSCTATAPRAAPMRGWRRQRPRIRVYTPHGGSLHYRPRHAAGHGLRDGRAAADAPHRPVPVREPLRPRHLSGHRSARRAAWCASCTTASAPPNSRRSRPAPDADRSRLDRRAAPDQGHRRPDRSDRAARRATAAASPRPSSATGPDGDAFRRLAARARPRGRGPLRRRPSRRAQAFALGRMLVVAVARGIAALRRARSRPRPAFR